MSNMLQLTETNIILAVIGSVGVIGSLIVLLYGQDRNRKYEERLQRLARQTNGVSASEDFSEVHTD